MPRTDGPEVPAEEHLLNGHGRRNAQLARVIANIGQVDTPLCLGSQSLGRVLSLRREAGEPGRIMARAIEHDPHGRQDVTLSEDVCTARSDNAPRNLYILLRLVLHKLKQDTAHPKRSPGLLHSVAGWDDGERILG